MNQARTPGDSTGFHSSVDNGGFKVPELESMVATFRMNWIIESFLSEVFFFCPVNTMFVV